LKGGWVRSSAHIALPNWALPIFFRIRWLPISRWHEQIGDPTIADGILDRLVHNAHRIEMRGESMRKKRTPRGMTAMRKKNEL